MWAPILQQPFDDTTQAYYQLYFEKLEIPAITQYEVFARSRAIDLLVTCTTADLPKLTEPVFAHFRTVNALEFKGYQGHLRTCPQLEHALLPSCA